MYHLVFDTLETEGLDFQTFLGLKRYVVPEIKKLEDYKKIFYNEYREYCEFNYYKYQNENEIIGGFYDGKWD